jgi:hypothetical protein
MASAKIIESAGANSKTYPTADTKGSACVGARPDIRVIATGTRMPTISAIDMKVATDLNIRRQLTGNVALTLSA